jgi:hypothetical protein
MVNIVIVALYIKYRLSPHECRPSSDVAMRNNLYAIWVGLTVSSVIENKFEMYSCEERGVKTRLH